MANTARRSKPDAIENGDDRPFWLACGANGPEGREFQHRSAIDPAMQGQALILFAEMSPTDAGRDIKAIRNALGETAVVVAVLPAELGQSWAVRLIELGADDAIDSQEPAAIDMALVRARRLLAERKQSAHKLAELACRQSYLQACIDNLPSPIFFKNREGVYVGCNKAFEDYIGLPAQAVIGASVYDIAPDYLAKVYEDADEGLMREGGSQIYEARVRYADGMIHDVAFHKAVTYDGEGSVNGLAGAMLDITERKRMEEQLRESALRDPMTNALNRRGFYEQAEILQRQAQASGEAMAVMVIDVDHFKVINDRHGHACGDAVLRRVVELLGAHIGAPDMFARVGGEEFFAVFIGRSVTEVAGLASKIRAIFAASPVSHDGRNVGFTASFGIARLKVGHEDIDKALGRADKALYQAKNKGRDQVLIAEG